MHTWEFITLFHLGMYFKSARAKTKEMAGNTESEESENESGEESKEMCQKFGSLLSFDKVY